MCAQPPLGVPLRIVPASGHVKRVNERKINIFTERIMRTTLVVHTKEVEFASVVELSSESSYRPIKCRHATTVLPFRVSSAVSPHYTLAMLRYTLRSQYQNCAFELFSCLYRQYFVYVLLLFCLCHGIHVCGGSEALGSANLFGQFLGTEWLACAEDCHIRGHQA